MRRALILGLSLLILLGAGGALLLLDEDRAPLPSEDELRTDGFAVWPEDTVSEGMDACSDAEPWRLDPKETAFQFVREVLKYPEPHLNTEPDDDISSGFRYLIGTKGVRGVFLGSVVDVRKYDHCWFVVSVSPREDGFPTNLSLAHRSGQPQLAVKSTAERTQVGYGPWEESVDGGKQVLFDLPALEPAATGHFISLSCRRVCDASGGTLGFVPEPATTDVVLLPREELARMQGCYRTGGFPSQLRALVDLYAMTVQKPVGIWYGKPKVGNVVIKRQRQLRHLGIEPLGGGRWSFQVDDADLEARIIRIHDRCWSITSIDDPNTDVLRSLHVGEDTFTFDLRWGEATSADIVLTSARGGDSWEFNRLDSSVTITGLSPRPLEQPFVVEIELRDGRTVVSREKSWYRTRGARAGMILKVN